MDRRSVRPNGAGSRRSHEPPVAGDTEFRKVVGATRTVTLTNSQRVVTRRSVGGVTALNYEVDSWETSPKTDYTYSRTRSYLKEPVNDNYITPNMSRQGLRRSATPHASNRNKHASAASGQNSTVAGNMVVDESYEEKEEDVSAGVRGSVGDGGGDFASGDSPYMTLRSRKLPPGNWRSDNTFPMRNMHGTDHVEESEEVEVSDTESTHDQLPTGSEQHSFLDQLSSFIVTVVQVCWTVVTYLPRTAVSKTLTLFTGNSKSNTSNNSHKTTKRARTTALSLSSATTTTTTTTTMSHFVSKWHSLRDTVLTVISFVFFTLPSGLCSWVILGVMSASKFTGQSIATAWQSFESILQPTFTKMSRVPDAALLSQTSWLRRHCGCLCLVPFLILLPLLLFGLLYVTSCQREDVAVVGSAVYDRFSAFFFPLFAASEEKEVVINPPIDTTTVNINTGGAGKMATDQGSPGDSDSSLLMIADLEKRMRDLFLVLADDHKVTARAEQDRTLSAFRSHLDRLVKMIVQRELQVQRMLIKSASDDGRAHLMLEQHKQMEALQLMRNSMDALAKKADSLSEELKSMKKEASLSADHRGPQPGTGGVELVELEEHIRKLNVELSQLQGKYDDLTTRMAKWPSEGQVTTLIRTRIHEYFVQVMGAGAYGDGTPIVGDDEGGTEAGKGHGTHPFEVWLNQHYTNREDMNKELESLAVNITKEINEKTAAHKGLMVNIVEAAVAAKLDEEAEKRRQDGSVGAGIIGTAGGTTEGSAPCTLCDGQLTVEDVLKLVRTELGIYDADKTGKVDYALESAGGSVISIRCSQTYQMQTAQTSVFGIALWYTYNSPRVIIQPSVHPGECWAFTGSQGYAVVQLARRIFITEVSIEHIPRSLSPSGRIDSAPKDFGIWGLESETDLVGVPLGNFTYDDMGTPIQTFSIEGVSSVSFRFVELKVNSNYGQESYTCLYRFRVHGYVDPSLV